MNKFSAAISDEEARAAAEYFAAMQPLADWFDVVETDTVVFPVKAYETELT